MSGLADTPVRGPGRYGWVVLAVVWLCGFVAPLNMVKVTALSPVLMASFGIDEALMGTIMSLFYVLGIVMAFPAAGIVNQVRRAQRRHRFADPGHRRRVGGGALDQRAGVHGQSGA